MCFTNIYQIMNIKNPEAMAFVAIPSYYLPMRGHPFENNFHDLNCLNGIMEFILKIN